MKSASIFANTRQSLLPTFASQELVPGALAALGPRLKPAAFKIF